MAAEVKLKNVNKTYGKDTVVIPSIDLTLPKNELTVFVGPSGCGKSTLLKMIAGLEEATSGQIFIGDKDVTDLAPGKRGIAMVFQSYALYPHMTVAENMAFALKIAKTPKDVQDAKVKEVAQILKLEQLLDRKPRQLSGGQRQRVAIGRALVRNPDVFLLDEPLSNLDAALRVDMRIEIAKIREHLNATMVYVTHDQVEAMTLADNIVVLNKGIIEQMGPPLDIYHKPVNKFVAGFLGSPSMNFVQAKIEELKSGSDGMVAVLNGQAFQHSIEVPVREDLANSVKAGTLVEMGIRPEHIQVLKDETAGQLRFEAHVAEYLGDHSLFYGKAGPSKCTLKVGPDLSFELNKNFGASFDTSHCHVFNADGINIAQH